MVLRNWYNLMKACVARKVVTKGLVNVSGSLKNAGYYMQPDELNILNLRPNGGLSFNTNSGTYIYYIFGSGTTPATLGDYKLKNMITSGLKLSRTTAMDEDNDTIHKLTLTNTSDASITIGEVGIFGACYCAADNASYEYALLERTVLDSPITIPAGGFGIIDYTIKIPIPTV